MALNKDIHLTYLGHATFMARSAAGKNSLIDPWVMGNPALRLPFQAVKSEYKGK